MAVEQLWFDLGQTMRRIRDNGGMSLAAAADVSGWTKGTLSQVERGKGRPSRELVDWYDSYFSCHGMLLAIWAEARAAASAGGRPPALAAPPGSTGPGAVGLPAPPAYPLLGDEIHIAHEFGVAHGQLVSISAALEITWQMYNVGSVAWSGRCMLRLGPYAGGRVISSPRRVVIPDTEPGGVASVTCPLRAPYTGGTFIAYWKMADADEVFCFPHYSPASALIIVEQPLFDPGYNAAVEAHGYCPPRPPAPVDPGV